MKNKQNFPEWLPDEYIDFIKALNNTTLSFPLNAVNTELAHKLCGHNSDTQGFWVRFNKLLPSHVNNNGSAELLFASLLFVIEHGLSQISECWDTKATKQREAEIKSQIEMLKGFKSWIKKLAPQSPVWRKLRSCDASSLPKDGQEMLSNVENVLKLATVERPFIAPEAIPFIDMQIDLFESSLYQLSSDDRIPDSRTINTIPFRGDRANTSAFIRYLAKWFTEYFGSAYPEQILELCSIFLTDEVDIDYLKGTIRTCKALNLM